MLKTIEIDWNSKCTYITRQRSNGNVNKVKLMLLEEVGYDVQNMVRETT